MLGELMLSQPSRSGLPLALYPRVQTTDFDEAAQLYSRFATPVRLTRTLRRTPFSWRANQLNVGPLGVSASELAGGVSAQSEGPVSEYHLSIPLSEARGDARSGKAVFPMVKGRSALVSSPGDHANVVLQPGFQGLGLNIPRAAMHAALTTLSGHATGAVHFRRTLALDAPKSRPLLRLLGQLLANADLEPSPFTSPRAAAFSEALLFQLLLCHPHSEARLLNAPVQAAEPRYVRRAVEYLDTHLSRQITMAELTGETGVSARSLQLGFQRHRGCSPLHFLHARRLQRARVLLLTDEALQSVRQAAELAGFQHMGRFSVQYRERFGETPTSTLARRWGR
jgi:AraC-like DNA-binding protein